MEPATSPVKFVTFPELKALSDRKENVIVYNHLPTTSVSDKFTSPFNTIKAIPTAHTAQITILEPFLEVNSNKHYLISASYDKDLKLWDLSTEPATVLDTLKHPKKVDFGFLDVDRACLIYSDKTGDIFQVSFQNLKLSKPEAIQANMSTLTLLDRKKLADGKERVVIADEYQKMKICKYPEIYEITNIFSQYKDSYFVKILDLTPNALVAFLSTGEVDLIDPKSLDENEYLSDKLDYSQKIEGKKIYDIYKVNSDYFLLVDEFFTVVVVIRINGNHVVEDKIVDITHLKILKNEKDHETRRFIEAERNGESLILFFKYERSESPETTEQDENKETQSSEDEIKLNENVFVKKLVINL